MCMLSKDYKKLYELICSGRTVAAFVDHSQIGSDVVSQDICQVRKYEDYRIMVFARGTTYAGVYPFQSGRGSEINLFVVECNAVNLQWIDGFSFENSPN